MIPVAGVSNPTVTHSPLNVDPGLRTDSQQVARQSQLAPHADASSWTLVAPGTLHLDQSPESSMQALSSTNSSDPSSTTLLSNQSSLPSAVGSSLSSPAVSSLSSQAVECPICLNVLLRSDPAITCCTNHSMHFHCASRWAEIDSRCPVCKRDWSEFHPLTDIGVFVVRRARQGTPVPPVEVLRYPPPSPFPIFNSASLQ